MGGACYKRSWHLYVITHGVYHENHFIYFRSNSWTTFGCGNTYVVAETKEGGL